MFADDNNSLGLRPKYISFTPCVRNIFSSCVICALHDFVKDFQFHNCLSNTKYNISTFLPALGRLGFTAQTCPGVPCKIQAHRDLYIHEPPFLVPPHVIGTYIFLDVAFTAATFYCCLVHAAATCYTFWLVPVTSGTTCTGLHTLIRTPVIVCGVFG